MRIRSLHGHLDGVVIGDGQTVPPYGTVDVDDDLAVELVATGMFVPDDED